MPHTHQAYESYPRFRIATVSWVFALFAAAMASFGPGMGIAAASLLWVLLLARSIWPLLTWIECLVIVVIIMVLIALLLPAVASSYPASLRNRSLNQLKQLTLAMHVYHDMHGSLPPPYSTDDEGTPLHSWRTLLLPYFDEQQLYG